MEHSITITTVESGKKFAQCRCGYGTPILEAQRMERLIVTHYIEVGYIEEV